MSSLSFPAIEVLAENIVFTGSVYNNSHNELADPVTTRRVI